MNCVSGGCEGASTAREPQLLMFHSVGLFVFPGRRQKLLTLSEGLNLGFLWPRVLAALLRQRPSRPQIRRLG